MSLDIRHWLSAHQLTPVQLHSAPLPQLVGIAFRIAQDLQGRELTLFDVSTFAETLALPLSGVLAEGPALAQITLALVRLLSQQRPLKRNEGVWLAYQVAYLRGLQQVLNQELALNRPWIERAKLPLLNERGTLEDGPLQTQLRTLRPGQLTDAQAEQVLSTPTDSFLVQQMNGAAIAWFMASGAEETEAKLMTQRILNGLAGHLLGIVTEAPLSLAQLQKFVRLGNTAPSDGGGDWSEDYEPIDTAIVVPKPALVIDLERERYRAALLRSQSEPLLGEMFTLRDLYVSLSGNTLSSQKSAPEEAFRWAAQQLQIPQAIAVLEGESGQGKTGFCQLWAAHVAQAVYPQWMPIVIRLRDVTIGETLADTLASALPQARFTEPDGWLSAVHPPCLLLLDGLDELPRSPQGGNPAAQFVRQVQQFLAQETLSPRGARHKLLLTTPPAVFQAALNTLTTDEHLPYYHLRLLPMEQEELKQWFKQWAGLQTKAIAQAYFNFLKKAGLFRPSPEPDSLAARVRHPLMLYLLGILHRDGHLDEGLLSLSPSELSFEMQDRLLRWLTGQTIDPVRSGSLTGLVRSGLAHASRGEETITSLLLGRSPARLQQQIETMALAIQQSQARRVLPRAVTPEAEDAGGWFPLPALYFSAPGGQLGQDTPIEFTHPSFGAFLGAKAIARQLATFAQPSNGLIEDHAALNALAHWLYHQVNYQPLRPDMVEAIAADLQRLQRTMSAFQFSALTRRLEAFYQRYCRGDWLDQGLPQDARQAGQQWQTPPNLLTLEAAVGLNAFLLLCTSHHAAQSIFCPCGDPKGDRFDRDRFLQFLHRISPLSLNEFQLWAQPLLSTLDFSGANLEHLAWAEANLQSVNLAGARLSGSDLTGANLVRANLSNANLSRVSLAKANLSGANLNSANLRGTDLRGAILKGVNWANTCLFEARLSDSDRREAEEQGAIFSLETFQAYTAVRAAQDSTPEPSPVAGDGELADTTLIVSQPASLYGSESDVDLGDSEDATLFMADS